MGPLTPEKEAAARRCYATLKALLWAKTFSNELARIAIDQAKDPDYDGEAMAVRVIRLARTSGLSLGHFAEMLEACGTQALKQRDPSKGGYTVHEYDWWLMKMQARERRERQP